MRHGAYRGGPEASAPSFEMQLPPVIGAKPVLVRIPRPFGDDGGVALLDVVVDDGPADAQIALVDAHPAPRTGSRAWIAVGVVLVLALIAALRLLP